MAMDRAAEFMASAAECLLLASSSTDPIVREDQLARAEALLRLAEKHERVAASQDQTSAEQQLVRPNEPKKMDRK
jgi:hypothetical protein